MYRSAHKDMEIGDRIVVIEEVRNGLLQLNPLDEGKIVDLRGQVSAGVWFRHVGQYHNEPVSQALELETHFHKKGRLHGVVMELDRKYFALRHRYGGTFDDVWVDEDRAVTIPFFEMDEQEREKSNRSVNVGGGVFKAIYQYPFPYVMQVVDEAFTEWTEKHSKTRRLTEEERDSGEYPSHWETALTEESSEAFHKKKDEVEIAFAKATGVYVPFLGGLIFE